MAMIEIEGGELYFSDHGDGPLIVLAHGIGGNHAVWYQQIATLARSYRVVAFDHRGFGLSRDASGEGRGAFARDLLALLDHLAVDKAVLVGQSMGGGSCIAFAGLHPDRVAALVVASSLHALVESDAVAALMQRARADTEALPQFDRVLSDSFRRDHPEATLLYGELSSFNRTSRRSLTGEWPLLQTPEQLGALGLPVLFIAAALDRLFPVAAMRQTQARVKGAFLVEIDDAGHSAFFERPAEFNDSLLSFLQMCRITGRAPAAHSNMPGYRPGAR
jgi:pimeloyl-ACP methyl ester carboxylesterase